MRRIAALLLAFTGIAMVPQAFAATSPLAYVRGIQVPDAASVIGLESFPAVSVGTVAHPAQRFLITLHEVYLLPQRGSNDAVSPFQFLPGTHFFPGSAVGGWVRPDGDRELVLSARFHNCVRFDLESGTIINDVPVFVLFPTLNSLQIDSLGNGFTVEAFNGFTRPTDGQLFAVDITAGVPSILTISGTGNGQLQNATGVSIGPDGLLYVLDTGNHRIQGFTEAGAYVRQFPLQPAMIGGQPVGVGTQFAVAPNGRFYVGDDVGNGTVYDRFGTLLGTFSTPTPGGPDINLNPQGHPVIAVDPDGTVLINTGSGLYVHEFVPVPVIPELIDEVAHAGIPAIYANILLAKLNAAENFLNQGNNIWALIELRAFIDELRVLQATRHLPANTAAFLITYAQAVINSITGK